METTLHISDTPQQVAADFASFISKIAENRAINIALSGGSTPEIVFDSLASDYKDQINWRTIHFYWGDERCVPPDNEESNYKMTNDHLFNLINIPKENIHRIKGESDPKIEVQRYAQEIAKNVRSENGFPVFDLVILGLGDDGHTASIFPDQLNLIDSTEITEIAIHPVTGQKRITLTGTVINNAKLITFLVTGANKKAKFTEILRKSGDWESYPATYISPTNGELHWFTDIEIN